MKPTEDLYQLIQSLSAGEKWYFRVYCRRHFDQPGKNYLKLFDAIDKQKEYDEAALKKQFAKEKFIRQLSVTKNYLYQRILESLEAHYSTQSVQNKIDTLLHQIEVLYLKGLYHQANKLLRRGQKIAAEKEILVLQMRLLHWERVLSYSIYPLKRLQKEMERLTKDELKLTEEHRIRVQYRELLTQMRLRMIQVISSRVFKEKLVELFDHPLLKGKCPGYSVQARCYYNLLKSHEYRYKGDLPKAYEYFKAGVDLIERHPEKMSEHPIVFATRFVSEAYNMLNLALDMGYFDDFCDNILKRTLTMAPDYLGAKGVPASLSSRMYATYYAVQMRRYIVMAELDKGKLLAKEIEEKMKGPHPPLNDTLPGQPHWVLCMYYFSAGQYEKALPWLNSLLNDVQMVQYPTVYSGIKILALVIHFELGNDSLLEYHVKSMYHFLHSKTKLFEHEKLLLKFFKRDIRRIENRKEVVNTFKKLHQSLSGFDWKTHHGRSFRQLNLLPWLQSHIESRPLPEILKEKAAKEHPLSLRRQKSRP